MTSAVKTFTVAIVLILSGCAVTVQRTAPTEGPLALSDSAARNVVTVIQGAEFTGDI